MLFMSWIPARNQKDFKKKTGRSWSGILPAGEKEPSPAAHRNFPKGPLPL